MDIVSDQSIFSREAREERADNIGSLFLWSVAIVILLGLNAFSWVFCMYVFGNPEVPFCYRLLTRLDKLDPIEGFEPVTAPRGQFNAARSLYAEYYDPETYDIEGLNALNGILKRYYLKNYFETGDVVFLSGPFNVETVRTLDSGDVFPHGLAVRLKAEDFPDAHVDLVLPVPEDVEIPEEHFRKDDLFQVEESAMCAALLHVHRGENDQMVFSAVPLVKREEDSPLPTPAGSALIVSPPERLNLDTGRWPLSDDPAPEDAPAPIPAPLTGEAPSAEESGEDESEAEAGENADPKEK